MKKKKLRSKFKGQSWVVLIPDTKYFIILAMVSGLGHSGLNP